MKKLILLTLLFNPIAYAQESLQLACVKNNINKIKKESQCQTYSEQLNSLKKPNCLYASTISDTVKIMKEAQNSKCIIETPTPPKIVKNGRGAVKVFNYKSEADIGRLIQYIEAYNDLEAN
jgi:hypothetical protein